MKQIFTTLCLILISAMCFAGINKDAGTYGYKFLNVPMDQSFISGRKRSDSSNNSSAFILQPALLC